MLLMVAACAGTDTAGPNGPTGPADNQAAAADNAANPAPDPAGQLAQLRADASRLAGTLRSRLDAIGWVRVAVVVAPWAGASDAELEAAGHAAVAGASGVEFVDVVPARIAQSWIDAEPEALRDALGGEAEVPGSSARLRALIRQLGAGAVMVVVGPWTREQTGGVVLWLGDLEEPAETVRAELPLTIPEADATDLTAGPLTAIPDLPRTRIDAAVLTRQGFAGMPGVPAADRALPLQTSLRLWFRITAARTAETWLIMPDNTAYRMWPDRTYLRLTEGAVLNAPQHAWLQLTVPGNYLLVIEALPAGTPPIGGPTRAGATIRDGEVLRDAAALWKAAELSRQRDALMANNVTMALQLPAPLGAGDVNGRRLMLLPDSRLEWTGRGIDLVGRQRLPVGRFPQIEPFSMPFGPDRLLQPDIDSAATTESDLVVPFQSAVGIGGATWVWPFSVGSD